MTKATRRILPLVLLALLGTMGCRSTGVLTSNLGVDSTPVEEAARQPVSEGMAGASVWPRPGPLYNGARQLPTAPVALAYDLGLATCTELGQLVSWTWGGQDAVSARAYSTWWEWRQVDQVLNPLPRWQAAAPVQELPGDHLPVRTGWTVAGAEPAPEPGTQRITSTGTILPPPPPPPAPVPAEIPPDPIAPPATDTPPSAGGGAGPR